MVINANKIEELSLFYSFFDCPIPTTSGTEESSMKSDSETTETVVSSQPITGYPIPKHTNGLTDKKDINGLTTEEYTTQSTDSPTLKKDLLRILIFIIIIALIISILVFLSCCLYSYLKSKSSKSIEFLNKINYY